MARNARHYAERAQMEADRAATHINNLRALNPEAFTRGINPESYRQANIKMATNATIKEIERLANEAEDIAGDTAKQSDRLYAQACWLYLNAVIALRDRNDSATKSLQRCYDLSKQAKESSDCKAPAAFKIIETALLFAVSCLYLALKRA